MSAITINPDALRARLNGANRMPQLLQLRDEVRVAMRQASDAMDESDDGGAG